MKALLSLIISGALVVSGHSQTRNVLVGTNNAVVQPTNFWSADAVNARTGLGLGSAATNPASAFQSSSSALTNLASGNGGALTNIQAASLIGLIPSSNIPATTFTNISGTLSISSGGTGATNAGGARTNLGLGAVWLTNTSVTNFRADIGLGSSSQVEFATISAIELLIGAADLAVDPTEAAFGVPFVFTGTNAAANIATSRTNLGLGWSALTNSNAGTGLVSVNTNGEVVSPTNFWQAAPITTTFIESQPTTNSSTNISPSRLLHIHSLATNIVNTTNTIVLPTNTLTFEGDMAMVVHKGPTNSLTQVRQAGSTNNLITLNKFNEAVEFTYYNNAWQFLETAAFTAPIYFSGTNAAASAAASRTNLGLGTTNAVTFGSLSVDPIGTITVGTDGTNSVAINISQSGIEFEGNRTNGLISFIGTNLASTFRSDIGLGATDNVQFETVDAQGLRVVVGTNVYLNFANDGWESSVDGRFDASVTVVGDLQIRNDFPAGTSSNGLLYIRRTNAEPFLGLANLIASNNTTISNETLFRVGVSEATNKAAQFGFRSTNTNGNGVAVFSVFGYNALMMIGPSDPNAGTNPIQATVYSIAPTNKVMTLITTNTGATLFHRAIEFENTTNQAVTRTNLGLPLAALTNTNNAGFQRAIFQTNTTPTNGANLGDAKAWIEISVVTNSVTNSYRIPVFQ